MLLKNLRLKLISIAFAFALWFFVAGQSPTELGIMVPLGYKGMPKDMVMTSAPFGEVEVRVTGPRFLLNNIEQGKVMVELDLGAAREGLSVVRILPKDINVPMGVKVARVVPSSVEVRLERLADVELPVRVRLSGRPAAGYRVSGVDVRPKKVMARAFARYASDKDAIFTRPVDVNGLANSVDRSVGLDAPENEFVNVSDYNVRVRVTITGER
ncbi:MAG: YbbR-like domain-containing protein [Deltaproteobacteria bacterium]|nr:YbbR-like domain-containing protein [Deltaproteobacteria bacterium]